MNPHLSNHNIPFEKLDLFDFLTAITINREFSTWEDKIVHQLQFSTLYTARPVVQI